jgi:hypothetical protein
MKMLRRIELRYVLTMHLARHGRSAIDELVEALAHHGFVADDPERRRRELALLAEAIRSQAGISACAAGL